MAKEKKIGKWTKKKIYVLILAKGQLISEQIFCVLKLKQQQNIARISALASKMGQIKKRKAIFYTKL